MLQPLPHTQKLITVAQAAQRLQLTRGRIHQLIKANKLDAYQCPLTKRIYLTLPLKRRPGQSGRPRKTNP